MRQLICEYYDGQVRLDSLDSLMQNHSIDFDETKLAAFLPEASDSDFLDFILPHKAKALRRLGQNRQLTICLEVIAKLVDYAHHAESELAAIKAQLASIAKDMLSVYKEIDPQDSGFIDSIKLHKFLLQLGLATTTDDLICIIRRMDKDNDGFISLLEFLNEFHAPSLEDASTQSPTPLKRNLSQLIREMETNQNPIYSDDARLFALFMEQYAGLAESLLSKFQIEPQIFAHALRTLPSGEAEQYRRAWNLSEAEVAEEEEEYCEEEVREFVRESVGLSKEVYRLKVDFVRAKKQSYLSLFQNIAHSIYLDPQDITNLYQ